MTISAKPAELTADACAQAAAWIARLHGPERSAQVEAGLRRWLEDDPAHRAAFDMANDIWGSTERLPKSALPTFVRWPRAGVILTVPRALAAAAALSALVLASAVMYLRDSGLKTRVGEQRAMTLDDGTRLALNTDTQVAVNYGKEARRVELKRGEAVFTVAKQRHRPFIVTAGGQDIVAIGTAFIVRREAGAVTVTLLEGRVKIVPSPDVAPAQTRFLAPGERLTVATGRKPALDRPALAPLTAWQRGQVIFDHTPLSDAIAEMNRYSSLKLQVEHPGTAVLQVTGVFRTGDSRSFAQAIGSAYGLDVMEDRHTLLLTGAPPMPR